MNRLAGLVSPLVLLGVVSPAFAQATASSDLLRLVPDNMGVCLVIHDLRGYADAFEKSPWYKLVKKSPLGAALSDAPEVHKLTKFAEDLGKRLKLTWPQVRDEIFGNAVVLAHRAAAKAEDEQGLFLLKAANAKLLAEFVNRINHEQTQRKEVKDVVELKYKGRSYFRRLEKNSTHYYYVQDAYLFLTSQEDLLRRVLDVHADPKKSGPLPQHLQRARADRALASLWINPRSLDGELKDKANAAQGAEAYGLKKFLTIWQALDAVVLSFTPGRELEVALSLQARVRDLPEVARSLFRDNGKPSELWQRFPKDAVVTIAGRLDNGMLNMLADFTPPTLREDMSMGLSNGVRSVLRLDLFKDVTPNVGPDWGISVAAAPNAGDFPHILAALAVRPGDKNVDQALVKGIEFFSTVAALKSADFNLSSVDQGKVKVHVLSNDKVFPPGLRPAYALKDGFLVLGSCPEAILRFGNSDVAPAAAKEALFFRLSMTELTKVVKQYKNQIAAFVALKSQVSHAQATAALDDVLKFLAPFDQLTLSHRADAAEVAWILRLSPAKSAE
jgi:hypothetical protein